MSWLVSTDERTCIGAGVCAGVGPTYFELVNGRSVPLHAEVDPDEELVEVADCCPMSAIRVVDKATGAVVAPVEQ